MDNLKKETSLNNLPKEDEAQLQKFTEAKEKLNPPSIEETAEKVVEYTDLEKEAIGMGWDPEGNKAKISGKRILTAEEFIDRKQFFDERKKAQLEIKKLQEQNIRAVELAKKAAGAAYQKALDDLAAKRALAVREGDVTSFNAVEAEMLQTQRQILNIEKEVSEPAPEASVAPSINDVPLEALEFKERNKSWFNTDTPMNTAMSTFAAKKDEELYRRNPNSLIKDRLLIVEEEVKKEFHKYFKNPNQEKPASVTVTTQKGTNSEDNQLSKFLTPHQKELGASFVAKGLYKNLDAYADVLKVSGRLRIEDK